MLHVIAREGLEMLILSFFLWSFWIEIKNNNPDLKKKKDKAPKYLVGGECSIFFTEKKRSKLNRYFRDILFHQREREKQEHYKVHFILRLGKVGAVSH